VTVEEATADAARIRAEAEREAAAYVDAARRRADAFAEARIARLRELTDRLIATAETVDQRFGEAATVKQQLDDLVSALGAAAQRVATEVASPGPPPRPAPRPGTAVVEVLEPARAPSRPSGP